MNLDQQLKNFMYEWNKIKSDNKEPPITKEEYYAVAKFVEYLKKNY